MRTAAATATRTARYDLAVQSAIPHIEAARTLGAKCAEIFASYLNDCSVPAPSGSKWTKDAVLRVLRRAKALGIDKGSSPPASCKTRQGRGMPAKFSEAFLNLNHS